MFFLFSPESVNNFNKEEPFKKSPAEGRYKFVQQSSFIVRAEPFIPDDAVKHW